MPAVWRLVAAACCAATVLAIPATESTDSSKKTQCKNIPGDKDWPKPSDWDKLSKDVKGKLTATVPLASVCHDPNYDETKCAALKANWKKPETHLEMPESFFAPMFQNGTCDPFGAQSTPCTLGNYGSYSIKVEGKEDVQAAFKFAKKHNIRIVIKNTGHDFLGKSAGKGSLILWTHNMKDKTFIQNYKGSTYTGPAVKMGAGVIVSEAYLFARQNNARVHGGSCATVGVVGGYTSGGGHNPIMGHHGMAADSVLEWEVVTPEGKHVIAKPEGQYKDLYWALSGGGAGTWGVVLSLTTKAFPDGPVGGAEMTVPAAGLDPEVFWNMVNHYYTTIRPLTDTGAFITTLMLPDALVLVAFHGFNRTAAEVSTLFAPFTSYLDANNIPHIKNFTYAANYYDHMARIFGPYPHGSLIVSQLTGGHLARKTVFDSPTTQRKFVDGLRSVVSTGRWYFAMDMFNLDSTPTARAQNRPDLHAINPAWRESRVHLVAISDWDYNVPKSEMMRRQVELNEFVAPTLKSVTGGVGTYLNEGNFEEVDWQNEFYGSNYPRLSKIKKEIDPDQILYARTAVGSERWVQDGEGRLCKV